MIYIPVKPGILTQIQGLKSNFMNEYKYNSMKGYANQNFEYSKLHAFDRSMFIYLENMLL